jgi:hypothetical protein
VLNYRDSWSRGPEPSARFLKVGLGEFVRWHHDHLAPCGGLLRFGLLLGDVCRPRLGYQCPPSIIVQMTPVVSRVIVVGAVCVALLIFLALMLADVRQKLL